ncbi:MAG: hypothetical protein ACPGID_00565 [Rubricella sp.]
MDAAHSDNGHLPIEVIRQHGGLRLSRLPGGSDALVVVFSGMGTTDQPIQPEELIGTCRDGGRNSLLFVIDYHRSWYSGADHMTAIGAAIRHEAALRDARKIVAVGCSMGGYGALVAPTVAQVDMAIALAPQMYVEPSLTGPCRFARFYSAATNPPFPRTWEAMDEDTRYVVLHGNAKFDRRHARKVPQSPNVTHFVWPDRQHEVWIELKERGVLAPFIRGLIGGDTASSFAMLGELGAARNGTDAYRNALGPGQGDWMHWGDKARYALFSALGQLHRLDRKRYPAAPDQQQEALS